ncbi:MAG TPA: hypothetical protein PKM88_10090 [bacterium]|nr:hypothetical protein [bacterium]
MELIVSRTQRAMAPADHTAVAGAVAAVKMIRVIATGAVIFSTIPVVAIIAWQTRATLPLPVLLAICCTVTLMDIVGAAVIWHALDRQRTALDEEAMRGQLEEIVCRIPDGVFWYRQVIQAYNLPEGRAPGAAIRRQR